jgi:hypothetical protein
MICGRQEQTNCQCYARLMPKIIYYVNLQIFTFIYFIITIYCIYFKDQHVIKTDLFFIFFELFLDMKSCYVTYCSFCETNIPFLIILY